MSDETPAGAGQPGIPVLLAAIDNALRNGSSMTGANLAFELLCERLEVDRDALPVFDPRWARPVGPGTLGWVNVADYGVSPENTAAQNDAGFRAACEATKRR